jgi:BMFP domain-containing protein YqiC
MPRRRLHILQCEQPEATMQTRNKIFDDLSQLMTNAMGVAQGAKTEAETAMKGMIDRFLADRDLVTREEFDAVRTMAQKAREENDRLRADLAALSERVASLHPGDRGPIEAGD